MRLKVWFEFSGYRNQSEGELFHGWIPFLYTTKCSAGVVYGLLDLIFFLDQGCVDDYWGDS